MILAPPSPDWLFDKLLVHHVLLYEKLEERDNRGGFRERYRLKAGFRGRIRPAGHREQIMAARWNAVVTDVLYMKTDTEIARGEMVASGGRSFRVVAVAEPSFLGHHYEVSLEEIQRPIAVTDENLLAKTGSRSSVRAALQV